MPRDATTNPLPARTDVLIIGAGMSGLAMGRQLKKAGIEDFVILERGDSAGGVWRANAYPGAACDVPSHLYSYSFYTNPDWSRKFAPQAEIKAYFQRAATVFGLEPHIHYNCTISVIDWDGPGPGWRVGLDDGRTLQARAVISAVGQLSEPFSPPLKGLERFEGTSIHTAEWTPDMDMSGQRVAVIGNAASAIQLLPHAAREAEQLTVFQRTPNWVIPKPDRAFTGFEKALFRYLPGYHWLYRMGSFTLHESRWPAFLSGGWAAAYTRHRLTRRIKSQVKNPDKLSKLLPDYAPGCKRILLSNDYFETLDQPHVHLNTDGVSEVSETAITTGSGDQIEVDQIILATGFKASEFLPSLTVTGPAGKTLSEVWGQSPTAYKGVAVSGFPNLFTLYGPNTNLGHNSIIFMIERQTEYVCRQVRRLVQDGISTLDVHPEAQHAFNTGLQSRLDQTVWAGECPSWYKSADGIIVNNWSGLASRFAWALRGRDDPAWQVDTYEDNASSLGMAQAANRSRA